MEVGYPRKGEVTRVFGGKGGSWKPACPYNLLASLDHVYMVDRMTRLGGLPGLLGRLTLSAGVTVCNVNMSW